MLACASIHINTIKTRMENELLRIWIWLSWKWGESECAKRFLIWNFRRSTSKWIEMLLTNSDPFRFAPSGISDSWNRAYSDELFLPRTSLRSRIQCAPEFRVKSRFFLIDPVAHDTNYYERCQYVVTIHSIRYFEGLLCIKDIQNEHEIYTIIMRLFMCISWIWIWCIFGVLFLWWFFFVYYICCIILM